MRWIPPERRPAIWSGESRRSGRWAVGPERPGSPRDRTQACRLRGHASSPRRGTCKATCRNCVIDHRKSSSSRDSTLQTCFPSWRKTRGETTHPGERSAAASSARTRPDPPGSRRTASTTSGGSVAAAPVSTWRWAGSGRCTGSGAAMRRSTVGEAFTIGPVGPPGREVCDGHGLSPLGATCAGRGHLREARCALPAPLDPLPRSGNLSAGLVRASPAGSTCCCSTLPRSVRLLPESPPAGALAAH